MTSCLSQMRIIFGPRGSFTRRGKRCAGHYQGDSAPPAPPEQGANPFEHPDAKRRFLILDENSDESLARYLDQPLAVWRFFLHPSQREIVDGNWRGPFRAIGAPGTGKTVCAMHRCKTILQRNDDARVLFTTYDKFLAQDIDHELKSFLETNRPIAARSLISIVWQ